MLQNHNSKNTKAEKIMKNFFLIFKQFFLNFKHFDIAKKLSVLLLAIFLGGTFFSGIVLSNILNSQANNDIISRANLLANSLKAVREYANNEVASALENRLNEDEFLQIMVPSFSVLQTFNYLRDSNVSYQDFYYKDAMLNPTNIRDRANNFETELIGRFLQNPETEELTGFKVVGNERIFYVAHPLAVTNPACLRCHSSPERAPKEMIKIYGSKNGFGWELNQINGVQTISIPATVVLKKAHQWFVVVMGIVTLVFATSIYLANRWLKQDIIRPINKLAQVAEDVSNGNLDAEFTRSSHDEIGKLTEAFMRLKLSLVMAIKRYEKYRPRNHKAEDE
jgi:methyl-accepting chemotaxis protein